MKYYLAPLEGITNVLLRSSYDKYFKNIDKYYIPFLSPKRKNLQAKDIRETNIDNNRLNGKVVPQIISKSSEDTLWLIDYLYKQGYDEVNLNFGCPSNTVVAKGKGAGMLANLEEMDNYLNAVISSSKCDISIKLRLGIENVNEFDNILKVLNKYKIKELIIHPRTKSEYYSGMLNIDSLVNLNFKTNIDIIYNGEIKSLEDIEYIKQKLPYIKGVMIGRGLISYPDMLDFSSNIEERKSKIKAFYYDFAKKYIDTFGWNNSNYFLKEIWNLLILSFDCPKSLKKKIFKANKQNEFEENIEELFKTCNLSVDRPSIKQFIK